MACRTPQQDHASRDPGGLEADGTPALAAPARPRLPLVVWLAWQRQVQPRARGTGRSAPQCGPGPRCAPPHPAHSGRGAARAPASAGPVRAVWWEPGQSEATPGAAGPARVPLSRASERPVILEARATSRHHRRRCRGSRGGVHVGTPNVVLSPRMGPGVRVGLGFRGYRWRYGNRELRVPSQELVDPSLGGFPFTRIYCLARGALERREHATRAIELGVGGDVRRGHTPFYPVGVGGSKRPSRGYRGVGDLRLRGPKLSAWCQLTGAANRVEGRGRAAPG